MPLTCLSMPIEARGAASASFFFLFFHVFSPWLDVVWVLCDRTRWDAERSLCKELYEEEVDKVKGLVPEGMASGPF